MKIENGEKIYELVKVNKICEAICDAEPAEVMAALANLPPFILLGISKIASEIIADRYTEQEEE